MRRFGLHILALCDLVDSQLGRLTAPSIVEKRRSTNGRPLLRLPLGRLDILTGDVPVLTLVQESGSH